MREALRLALEISDRYVWLYSEKANWWTGENLSEAYIKAVIDARVRYGHAIGPGHTAARRHEACD